MKKIISFIILLLMIFLSSCQEPETIYETRTIIIFVNSEVVPAFSSNFGEGEYDVNSKEYTHEIPYIKDLYIYISFAELKTETVYISTEEMKEYVIRKEVTFNNVLDAELEITIDGIKNLEGLEIINPNDYVDLILSKKNKFSLILPSREEDYNIEFTLPNYKKFSINLKEEDLVSGLKKLNIPAVKNNEVYIGIKGGNLGYKIYSTSTNEEVASNSIYENTNNIRYVILPNDTAYYVRIEFYNNGSYVIDEVEENVDCILEYPYKEYTGYITVENDTADYFYYYQLYDKVNERIISSNYIYTDLSNYGIIVNRNNENYYCNDITSLLINNPDQDSLERRLEIDFNKFVKVDLLLDEIDILTNEVNSKILESEFVSDCMATYEDNKFHIIDYVYKEAEINYKLYDKNSNYLTTINDYISKDFDSKIVEGITRVNGKNIIYRFPLFTSDLELEDGKYKDINKIVNADVSLIPIYISEHEDSLHPIYLTEYDNPYLLDNDLNMIKPTYVNNNAYFEMELNKEYDLYYGGRTGSDSHKVILTEDDMKDGRYIAYDKEIEYVKIKLPKDYNISINELYNLEFIPDSEGIIRVPAVSDYINGTISNDYTYKQINIHLDGKEIYELHPFIVSDMILYMEMMDYYWDTKQNYFYRYENDLMFGNPIQINMEYYEYIDGIHTYSSYMIDFDKFIYNEKYQGYYCSEKDVFDRIIRLEGYVDIFFLLGESNFGMANYGYGYTNIYLNDVDKLYYGGYEYDLSKYDSQYLDIVVNEYSLVITEIE